MSRSQENTTASPNAWCRLWDRTPCMTIVLSLDSRVISLNASASSQLDLQVGDSICEKELRSRAREHKCSVLEYLLDGYTAFLLTPSPAQKRNTAKGLSPRRHEVLELLRSGKNSAEIGIILGISKRTAEKHVQDIYSHFNVSSLAELMGQIQ